MTVIVLMQNDTPIGVYRTTRAVKSRIKAIRHIERFPVKKTRGQLSWLGLPVNSRRIYYWTEKFELKK